MGQGDCMSKLEIYEPITLSYANRIRNLKVVSSGVVKSTKFFPVFQRGNEQKIFKPLSKTKPFSTPLFAYSEVFWSYVTHHYFDNQAPIYQLAYCPGIEKEQPKYWPQGTLVSSLIQPQQRLVNLLEFFDQYPDEDVHIHDYVNYCMENYDYTSILNSKWMKNHPAQAEELARQILLSVLRQDQNFHYENVSFIAEKETILSIAPPIDAEFSTMFLFPDMERKRNMIKATYYCALEIPWKKWQSREMGEQYYGPITRNLLYLVEYYPKVVLQFVNQLSKFLEDLPTITLTDERNYIGPLHSEYWKIGHAQYKEGKSPEEVAFLKVQVIPKSIDKEEVFAKIIEDVERSAKRLQVTLKTYLLAKNQKLPLQNLTVQSLCQQLGIPVPEGIATIEDVDLSTQKLSIKKL